MHDSKIYKYLDGCHYDDNYVCQQGTAEFFWSMEFCGTEYSYNIYGDSTNQSSTMDELGNYIKCNFRQFDYIINVHVIRYMYDICLVYNFPTFI